MLDANVGHLAVVHHRTWIHADHNIAHLIGIDRSSVFRLAFTLKRRGFLAYPAGRKDFILGPAMWRLSGRWKSML